jgi:hypothetical protein
MCPCVSPTKDLPMFFICPETPAVPSQLTDQCSIILHDIVGFFTATVRRGMAVSFCIDEGPQLSIKSEE